MGVIRHSHPGRLCSPGVRPTRLARERTAHPGIPIAPGNTHVHACALAPGVEEPHDDHANMSCTEDDPSRARDAAWRRTRSIRRSLITPPIGCGRRSRDAPARTASGSHDFSAPPRPPHRPTPASGHATVPTIISAGLAVAVLGLARRGGCSNSRRGRCRWDASRGRGGHVPDDRAMHCRFRARRQNARVMKASREITPMMCVEEARRLEDECCSPFSNDGSGPTLGTDGSRRVLTGGSS
jgi:hypothetical protein